MLFDDQLCFDLVCHRDELALLAAKSLARGDFFSSYAYSDRRCRLLKPDARDLALRFEASRAAGFVDFAFQDLVDALEIDPTDIYVNRLALLYGATPLKVRAASQLIQNEATDRNSLKLALELLFSEGVHLHYWVRRFGDEIAGCVVWIGMEALEVRGTGEQSHPDFMIERDAEHEFAAVNRSAAEFCIKDPLRTVKGLTFSLNGVVAGSWEIADEVTRVDFPARISEPAADQPVEMISIIVPVYEDFAATKACLESLNERGGRIPSRLIIVDDHSPNAELREYVRAQARAHNFLLIENNHNLGFAASINKALGHCPIGDVVLVNADTWVPRGCIDQLSVAAYSDNEIGTATPLSNNGEFTSFPTPNICNPLPHSRQIREIDRIARIVNGSQVEDIPNGVGFFLYIKRQCLQAVGAFDEVYSRGYFEDVEFCLRASQNGFRNVCATGVYVGHAGTRSFKEEKRALVVRNLKILEERFPQYALQSALFLEANPLRRARANIEARLPIREPAVLFVCGIGTGQIAAEVRASSLILDGRTVSIYCTYNVRRELVEFSSDHPECPSSLSFSLTDPERLRQLRNYLAHLKLHRVELFDVFSIPDILLVALLKLNVNIAIVCADLAWVYPKVPAARDACHEIERNGPCASCIPERTASLEILHEEPSINERRLKAAYDRAEAIIPTDPMSELICRRFFPQKTVAYEAKMHVPFSAAPSHQSDAWAIAVLAPSPCAMIDRLIIRMCKEFRKIAPRLQIIVLGRCVNDFAIMATGSAFVSGPVENNEFPRVLQQYGIKALFCPYRTGFFYLLKAVAGLASLPKAYFDWSFGLMKPDPKDLSLDMRLCDQKAANRVATWYADLYNRDGRS